LSETKFNQFIIYNNNKHISLANELVSYCQY